MLGDPDNGGDFPEDSSSGEDLVKVETFWRPFEARVAHAMLEDAGIPAFLENILTIEADILLREATGGIRLMVPASRAEEARQLLASLAIDELPTEEPDSSEQ
jgi:hypothetical protein